MQGRAQGCFMAAELRLTLPPHPILRPPRAKKVTSPPGIKQSSASPSSYVMYMHLHTFANAKYACMYLQHVPNHHSNVLASYLGLWARDSKNFGTTRVCLSWSYRVFSSSKISNALKYVLYSGAVSACMYVLVFLRPNTDHCFYDRRQMAHRSPANLAEFRKITAFLRKNKILYEHPV